MVFGVKRDFVGAMLQLAMWLSVNSPLAQWICFMNCTAKLSQCLLIHNLVETLKLFAVSVAYIVNIFDHEYSHIGVIN